MSEIRVRGGVGGLQVQYDELSGASRRLRDEGGDLLVLAASRHRLLVDADLLASAVLHPAGFARVEAALLDALDGPSGVVAAGGRLQARAALLLVAVARYQAGEALAAELVDARRWLLGASAPLLAPAAAGVGTSWAVAVLASGGDPATELERALTEHPGVVDEAVGAVGGLSAALRAGLLGPLPAFADQAFHATTGQSLLPRDLQQSAALLALLYGPGRPVTTVRPDRSSAAVVAPRGVEELLQRLQFRNDEARIAAGRQGDVGVTRLVTALPDGGTRVSWVVDLPGTKDWQVVPGERPALNDLASNLELMAGIENARVEALAQILAQADVQPGEPVMLVGHSQGGMVAMRAAQALGDRFAVSHVVTAGSPVAGMAAPAGVQVLSLENRTDIVPRTDGRENADDDEHVTVLFDHQTGTVAGNHAIGASYLPAAREVDRSADVSVRAWLDGAAVFLAGPAERMTASTTVYTVANEVERGGV